MARVTEREILELRLADHLADVHSLPHLPPPAQQRSLHVHLHRHPRRGWHRHWHPGLPKPARRPNGQFAPRA